MLIYSTQKNRNFDLFFNKILLRQKKFVLLQMEISTTGMECYVVFDFIPFN